MKKKYFKKIIRHVKNKVKIKKKRAESVKDKEAPFLTGIQGFDYLVDGGFPTGMTTLVEGGPGSGKTVFCLNLAFNACKKGKKVLYMSFEEPEFRLRSHMKNFGWDSEQYEKKGLLMIRRFNALDIARSVEALLSEAKKELLIDVQPILIPKDFEPDIVLVDSLSSISSAFSGEGSRFRIYMEQLFRYLESHKITSFLIRETANPTHIGGVFVEEGEAVSFLSDGIISIYNVFYNTGKRGRALEIIKLRGVDIKRMVMEADIVRGKGFIVYNTPLKGKYTLT
ncbi:MAG: gas vesicle protein GvpD [archaeon]|nr:gas vesicle protein GvpD [archaeon]